MGPPDAEPPLADLEPLVGEWTLEATPPGGPPWPGEGKVTFEWLGTGFLVQRSTISVPEAPDSVSLIGLRDAPASAEAVRKGPDDSEYPYHQYYFDSRGVRRVFEMSFAGGEWNLWRDVDDPFPQRFIGRISEDGRTIEGAWERKDGSDWMIDFDLKYTKVS
jgi:hypothetical protein